MADAAQLPLETLTATLAGLGADTDPYGRDFPQDKKLASPYCAARVTGALFHTQGGLQVAPDARVKLETGGEFANLFAAGGAATGVSGTGDSGYLSGNGLLAAFVLGRNAGLNALRRAVRRD